MNMRFYVFSSKMHIYLSLRGAGVAIGVADPHIYIYLFEKKQNFETISKYSPTSNHLVILSRCWGGEQFLYANSSRAARNLKKYRIKAVRSEMVLIYTFFKNPKLKKKLFFHFFSPKIAKKIIYNFTIYIYLKTTWGRGGLERKFFVTHLLPNG